MKLSRNSLYARWAWTGCLALIMLAVMQLLDHWLKARTGYGTLDMQFVGSGYDLRRIVDHWIAPPDMALAGFLLGIDYLFMPLYGAALFFGSLAAFDRFAPAQGTLRVVFTRLTLAPIAAALCDAIENALQLTMLTHTPTNTLASFTLEASAGKCLGIAIGLVLTLAALAGRFVKGRQRA